MVAAGAVLLLLHRVPWGSFRHAKSFRDVLIPMIGSDLSAWLPLGLCGVLVGCYNRPESIGFWRDVVQRLAYMTALTALSVAVIAAFGCGIEVGATINLDLLSAICGFCLTAVGLGQYLLFYGAAFAGAERLRPMDACIASVRFLFTLAGFAWFIAWWLVAALLAWGLFAGGRHLGYSRHVLTTISWAAYFVTQSAVCVLVGAAVWGQIHGPQRAPVWVRIREIGSSVGKHEN